MNKIILKATNITKKFPGVLANDHINFELYEGEIHTLLGENGAGKTTFINILDGIYSPDEGEIYIDGKYVRIKSPLDAIRLGIGMIHQHFTLVDNLTVLENIILGLKEQKFIIDKKNIAKRITEISERYNFKINPYTKIWQLTISEQQKVEIIKILYRGIRILILDEPTAVLTPQETKTLFEILKKLKFEGKSIIFISHKLEEVMEISDRITVIRKGKVVGTLNKEEATQKDLAEMMVGREIIFQIEKNPPKIGKEVLRIENLECFNDRGIKTLKKLNLTVHEGEIFGIAGITGNGQEELSEVLAGLRKATNGKIYIFNNEITNFAPIKIIQNKIGYIPADRLKVGLVPILSSIENSILKNFRRKPISNGFLINYTRAKEYTYKLINEYNIMIPNIYAPVKYLSGGNLQKLLLARELSENPILLIAVYPTRGLDVAATEFVRKKLLEVRDKGGAVLLISEDLEELLMISDRIGVIFEGQIVGIVKPEEVDINEIGLMMSGSNLKNLRGEKYDKSY